MILNGNSEGWADMTLHDGEGNVIANCFEYNTETKEASLWVFDKSYAPPPNQTLICGRIMQDEKGNNISIKQTLPNSFIKQTA